MTLLYWYKKDYIGLFFCRGEKLYVTKDKRSSQSWKRCICWGTACVLIAIAILIAVLAGSKCCYIIYPYIYVLIE